MALQCQRSCVCNVHRILHVVAAIIKDVAHPCVFFGKFYCHFGIIFCLKSPNFDVSSHMWVQEVF